MASIQGWGRETWNSGAWNQQAPVELQVMVSLLQLELYRLSRQIFLK